MLCVVHTSAHSACTFADPRSKNRRKARLFDLPEDGFDHSLARGIDRGAGIGLQLARHAVEDRGRLRYASAPAGPGALAVSPPGDP